MTNVYAHYFPNTVHGQRYASFAHKKTNVTLELHSVTKNDSVCKLCVSRKKDHVHNILCSKYIQENVTSIHQCMKCQYQTIALDGMQQHM